MRRLPVLAIALSAVALATPAGGEEYDPYRIPRAQFHAQVKRIALQPLALPARTPDAARVRSELERAIAEELGRRGYAVVPSRAFEETWLPFATDLGGVFDPLTGQADAKKYELAWQHTARELERKQDADAVLVSRIAVEVVPFYEGWFGYRAADSRVRWQGRAMGVFWRPDMPQRLEGPYLVVEIRDPSYVSLYDVTMPLAWWRVFAGGGYEDLPPGEIYANGERNQKVVETLLAPLSRP